MTFERLCDLSQRIANSHNLPGDVSRLTGLPEHRVEEILCVMIKPVDNNCGECKAPVGLSERQQIFPYPPEKRGQALIWKRVCGSCLQKIRPTLR